MSCNKSLTPSTGLHASNNPVKAHQPLDRHYTTAQDDHAFGNDMEIGESVMPSKVITPPSSVKALAARADHRNNWPTVLVSTSRLAVHVGQYSRHDLSEEVAKCVDILCPPGRWGNDVCFAKTICKIRKVWWVDKGRFRENGDIIISGACIN